MAQRTYYFFITTSCIGYKNSKRWLILKLNLFDLFWTYDYEQAMQFFIKIVISALIIASVSEIAKRFTLLAAVIAALPLTSMMGLIWLYYETKDMEKVIGLSSGILWAVIPSLVFYIALPFLLKSGMKFSLAMILSTLVMLVGYGIFGLIINKVG